VQQRIDPFHEAPDVDAGLGSDVQFFHEPDDGERAFAVPADGGETKRNHHQPCSRCETLVAAPFFGLDGRFECSFEGSDAVGAGEDLSHGNIDREFELAFQYALGCFQLFALKSGQCAAQIDHGYLDIWYFSRGTGLRACGLSVLELCCDAGDRLEHATKFLLDQVVS
jgi:hypothetical protein